jgi:hypothetical protein
MDCKVCRSEDTNYFVTKKDPKRYWRCNNCCAVFTDPSQYIDSKQEKERYLEHNNSIDDPDYRSFLSRVTNPLKKNIDKASKGLDFGCGHGPALADILNKDGYLVDLYDPFFYPNKSIFNNKYNFITCTEAAEHFFNPHKEFESMDSMLEENGILVIMTSFLSNMEDFENWYYRRDPTHVVFYSQETFKVIAKQNNWKYWIEDKNIVFFKKVPQ